MNKNFTYPNKMRHPFRAETVRERKYRAFRTAPGLV
jgi:hypothetical protein